ncbi:DUF2520 domain-containing protein [Spirosoma luteolum]
MNISFIGAGNLAWHLAPAFESAGHHISEVYSRQPQSARRLISNLYDARLHDELNFAGSNADLFVLAVPDDALPQVCSRLVLPENAIVVHTSGSCSLDKLRHWLSIYSDVPVRAGVFYALQTFTREQPLLDFAGIPLCLEAGDEQTEQELVRLGQEISQIVYLVSSSERLVLHLGAVLACNFTNHLLAQAYELTMSNGLEFELLIPLIQETIRKGLSASDPADVQTGPARRGDLSTIQAHLTLLAGQPLLADIYRLMTESIRQQRLLRQAEAGDS